MQSPLQSGDNRLPSFFWRPKKHLSGAAAPHQDRVEALAVIGFVVRRVQDTPEQVARVKEKPVIPIYGAHGRCNPRRSLPPDKAALHLAVQLSYSIAHWGQQGQLDNLVGDDFRKGCLGRRMALRWRWGTPGARLSDAAGASPNP
jgi:hypothetical protein